MKPFIQFFQRLFGRITISTDQNSRYLTVWLGQEASHLAEGIDRGELWEIAFRDSPGVASQVAQHLVKLGWVETKDKDGSIFRINLTKNKRRAELLDHFQLSPIMGHYARLRVYKTCDCL